MASEERFWILCVGEGPSFYRVDPGPKPKDPGPHAVTCWGTNQSDKRRLTFTCSEAFAELKRLDQVMPLATRSYILWPVT